MCCVLILAVLCGACGPAVPPRVEPCEEPACLPEAPPPEAPVVPCASGGCGGDAACVEGASRCVGREALERCTAGHWRTEPCAAGCVTAAGRGWCGEPGATLSGVVRYARRGPRPDFTGWTEGTEEVPARGFLVASYSGHTLLDVQATDAQGRFTVSVPAAPGPADVIVVYAAGRGASGAVAYAVAEPGLSGEQRAPTTPGAGARIWSWSRPTLTLKERSVFSIGEAEGSGAAHLFHALATAWQASRERYAGAEGLPVVMWLGYGTTWSCGACFSRWPVTALGRRWEAQVWFPGDTDAAYWSDAVALHELGHWVMASHGTSPDEGGPHFIGVPTFPGQAWSEGWATWFSTDVRGSSRYYDHQGGTMFWMDLAAREYAWGEWPRPRPEDGLLQRLDENEVSAILLRAARGVASSQPLYEALAAPRMNRSPWARGYRRHTWRMGEGGTSVDVRETTSPAPCLADFLDALACRGFPRDVLDAATEPATAYPYPSHAPLCP